MIRKFLAILIFGFIGWLLLGPTLIEDQRAKFQDYGATDLSGFDLLAEPIRENPDQ